MAGTTKYVMRRFDSIGAFVKASCDGADEYGASSRKGRDDWSGAESHQQAADWATLGGWEPKNVGSFDGMFDSLEQKLRKFVDTDFVRGTAESGFEVNMQAYLDGEPDCMFEWFPDERMQTKRAVCLLIGHAISSGTTEDELFIRGQAAVALVRSLSLLGCELEIWSEQTVRSSKSQANERYSVLTRLHAAGSILDPRAVEFAIGNPSWLRRLTFGLEEGESDAIRTRYGFGKGQANYGVPDGLHHADLIGADMHLDLGRTWFAGDGWSGDLTARNGMNWVLSQLKELGVVADDAEFGDD
jgi:hypothetical protein